MENWFAPVVLALLVVLLVYRRFEGKRVAKAAAKSRESVWNPLATGSDKMKEDEAYQKKANGLKKVFGLLFALVIIAGIFMIIAAQANQ